MRDRLFCFYYLFQSTSRCALVGYPGAITAGRQQVLLFSLTAGKDRQPGVWLNGRASLTGEERGSIPWRPRTKYKSYGTLF